MTYTWSSKDKIEALSKESFGVDLAEAICNKLKINPGSHDLFLKHKDYCGHGLWFDGRFFELCLVSDGFPDNAIKKWDREEDFISFLSHQSDYSCSGADENESLFFTTDKWLLNNQRLTRERLEAFL